YPFEWGIRCIPGERPMCGENICAFRGSWHIAWSLPIRDIYDRFSWYFLAAFAMPFFYGSWRFTIYHLLTGPVLARLTTDSLNEWTSILCLLSIDLLLFITNTRVRNFRYVRRWPGCGRHNQPAKPKPVAQDSGFYAGETAKHSSS